LTDLRYFPFRSERVTLSRSKGQDFGFLSIPKQCSQWERDRRPFPSPGGDDTGKRKENISMGKERITRRQKDISRLIREKKKIEKDRIGKKKKK